MKMVTKEEGTSQLKNEEVDKKIQLIEKNIRSLKVSLVCSYVFTIFVALLLLCYMRSEIETGVQNKNQASPLQR